MGRAAAIFNSALDSSGDAVSALYHASVLDFKQAGRDMKHEVKDYADSFHPQTPEELAPEAQAPVVEAAPVVVDDAALALRRQRLLASSYGRSRTILDQPAAASSLGGSAGATQLGG